MSRSLKGIQEEKHNFREKMKVNIKLCHKD